nr:hypothetical protein [Rhodonellum psychrophilum]
MKPLSLTFVSALALRMNKFQLIIHHVFRFVWNMLFIISYPVLATFGILFVGVTYFFSALSKLLTRLSPNREEIVLQNSEWEPLSNSSVLLEGKIFKQIMFGPACYQIRRTDGIPSVLEDHYFGKKIKIMEEGFLLEKWNATESKDLPDFDICLYDPDQDKLTKLTTIKSFDWHLSQKEDDWLLLKWFDGTQGGEVKVTI